MKNEKDLLALLKKKDEETLSTVYDIYAAALYCVIKLI